jgi:hypothetical protein
MKRLVTFLCLLLLGACAQRTRPVVPQEGPPAAEGLELPEGVALSNDGSYFVKVAPAALVNGQKSTLTVRVVDTDLEPLDLEGAKIEVSFRQGEAEVESAVTGVKLLEEAGKIEVTVVPPRSGASTLTVRIEESGEAAEEASVDLDVK